MARTGISYFDVEQSALQLQGQGKATTVDNIRATLGTGSRTTIADHLKAWKTRQADGEGKLPSSITAVITGLWERLQTEANQQVEELRQSSDEERQKHQQVLTQTHQAFAELNKRLHDAQELYAEARQLNESSTKQIQHLQQENARSVIRENALTDQLNASRTENDRLHQLAKQIQANLAHYQASIETLRTEQTLAMDKQKNIWQQKMDALKKSLIEAQMHSQLAAQQAEEQKTAYQELQLQHRQLTMNYHTQEIQYKAGVEKLMTLNERLVQHEKSLENYQQELAHKNKQVYTLEQENALLSQQRQHAEKMLSQAEDKIDMLRDEKLFLTQEKSELAGQLQQILKTVERKIEHQI